MKKALTPKASRAAVEQLVDFGPSVRRACHSAGLSRSAWYAERVDWREQNQSVIEALTALAHKKPGLGFWKLFRRLRAQGHKWNHKRVYSVYKELKLNLRRRLKKRIPKRDPIPLPTDRAEPGLVC